MFLKKNIAFYQTLSFNFAFTSKPKNKLNDFPLTLNDRKEIENIVHHNLCCNRSLPLQENYSVLSYCLYGDQATPPYALRAYLRPPFTPNGDVTSRTPRLFVLLARLL